MKFNDNEFTAINIVGTECEKGMDKQFNKWYNDVHIPLFMKYDGLKKAARFKKLDPNSPISTYLAFYYYKSIESMNDLNPGRPEFKAALENMRETWKGNEIETKFAVPYEKIKAWQKDKSDAGFKVLNIVATECKPEADEKFNKWYNDIHIQFFLKYEGIEKIIRYKKLDPKSDMPKYLAFYYYSNKEAMDGMIKSPIFKEASEEMQQTWKEPFDLKWVASFEHIATIAK